MTEVAGSQLPAATPQNAAVQRLVRIATEALPPELAHLASGPLAESLAKAVDFARHAIAERTEKTYAENWTAFQVWCEAHGAPALPTLPALVAAYLSDRSATLGRSGLRLALAAISYQHRRAGHLSPTSDPVISSVLQGILRTSEALILNIRRSKADQEGEGALVKINRGSRVSTCPARAMSAWLKAGAITYGPVFRRITASGAIEARLTGNGVWKILRRRAAEAGLTVDAGERLSPHGMRAGFITEAYLNGALDEQVMAHARQKSVETTRRYRNRVKTVAASPTKLLDL